jgi:hypothetical protein
MTESAVDNTTGQGIGELCSCDRLGWQFRNLKIVTEQGECVRYIPTYKRNPVDFVCAGTPPV